MGQRPWCYGFGGELDAQGLAFAGKNVDELGTNLARYRSFMDGVEEAAEAPKASEAKGRRQAGTSRPIRPSGADICRWDAAHLPLRDGTVDAVVVDMPFGHLCGTFKSNIKL